MPKKQETKSDPVFPESDQPQSQTPQTPIRLVDFIGDERNNPDE